MQSDSSPMAPAVLKGALRAIKDTGVAHKALEHFIKTCHLPPGRHGSDIFWSEICPQLFLFPMIIVFSNVRKSGKGYRRFSLTWVLLQVWVDVVNFGCSSLSAVVSADEILLGF